MGRNSLWIVSVLLYHPSCPLLFAVEIQLSFEPQNLVLAKTCLFRTLGFPLTIKLLSSKKLSLWRFFTFVGKIVCIIVPGILELPCTRVPFTQSRIQTLKNASAIKQNSGPRITKSIKRTPKDGIGLWSKWYKNDPKRSTKQMKRT